MRLLGLLIFAAVSSSAPTTNVDRCRTRIASRLGELDTSAPGPRLRRGRAAVISGVVDALAKPPPAPPRMMAPTQILVTHYAFRCKLRSGVVKRVTVHRQRN